MGIYILIYQSRNSPSKMVVEYGDMEIFTGN